MQEVIIPSYNTKHIFNFLIGMITLKEAAKLINSDLLTQLKQEHGGLQTLFRNHHQVFVGEQQSVLLSSLMSCSKIFLFLLHLARDGFVQLRDWYKNTEDGAGRKRSKPSQRQLLHKTTLCWFHANHPHGCPRIECCYAHGVEDLTTRPQFLHSKPKK